MPRPLLSAALIVRDEERFLEACLRSLIGRFDEIVVVDTGSADRSREIAGDLGARLLQFRWTDDFAAARNAAVDASLGQWVLYIDADERVVEFDRAEAERLLAAHDHACYTVLFRPQSGFTRYREHRIFRNRPELRFRGVIHESLIPALDELVAREGARVGASSIGLEHDGYDGDIRHKHPRNLPLLEKRLVQDPAHVYSWAHLGATLLGVGDAEGAERAWRRGVDIVRSRASTTAADDLPYLHLANFLLERRRDATELLDEACRRFPDNYALLWLRGRTLVDAARYGGRCRCLDGLQRSIPTRSATVRWHSTGRYSAPMRTRRWGCARFAWASTTRAPRTMRVPRRWLPAASGYAPGARWPRVAQ